MRLNPARDPYAVLVGQTVRALRVLKGVPLQAMAEALGMSASGWSRVETGDTTMTVVQLRKAANILAVPPWDILKRAEVLYVGGECA